jgi:hypothetical protein
MAHYAELNKDQIVKRVLVIDNEQEQNFGEEGISRWLVATLGGVQWVKTSYNNTIRKNYAGIGYKYDTQLDAFIPPKPYPSWILNEDTCLWVAPVLMPIDFIDGKTTIWDEETQSWLIVDITKGGE